MNYFQPDKIKIGVLGGGQLGRMMIQSAINYNLYICCLDPDANAPCKAIANEFTNGSLTDYDTVYKFGKDKDIITIEIENVNVEALKDLQKLGKNNGLQHYSPGANRNKMSGTRSSYGYSSK